MAVHTYEIQYKRVVDIEVGVCEGCGKVGELVDHGPDMKWDARGWGMWKWPLDSEPHWTRGNVRDFPVLCSECSADVTEFISQLKERNRGRSAARG